MVNRALIRTKVVQTLYAYYENEGRSVSATERELQHSFEEAHKLYAELLHLPVAITAYAAARIDTARNKYIPTHADLNPNEKFVNNTFVKMLSDSKALRDALPCVNRQSDEYLACTKALFERTAATEAYEVYMKSQGNSFEKDKDFWLSIYEEVIVDNEDLEELLEAINIYWCGYRGLIDHEVYNSLRDIKPSRPLSLAPVFGTDNDSRFAFTLLSRAIVYADEYRQYIAESLKKWDAERIALYDKLILQTAVAELINFPDIPMKVTLNEYIELARTFSTPESSRFVHGILGGIVAHLEAERKITPQS